MCLWWSLQLISAIPQIYSAAQGFPTRFPDRDSRSLFRPRNDLDHLAFVFVRHLGVRAGIGLDRGASDQWWLHQQALGQFHRVERILVAKRRRKRSAGE